MKKRTLKKEVKDYIKYLLEDHNEYPFQAWLATDVDEDMSEFENEFAAISYHATLIAEIIDAMNLPY